MAGSKALTQEQVQWIEENAPYHTAKEIANRYGCSTYVAVYWANGRCLKIMPRWTAYEQRKLYKLWNANVDIESISKRLDRKQSAILARVKLMRSQGYSMKVRLCEDKRRKNKTTTK